MRLWWMGAAVCGVIGVLMGGGCAGGPESALPEVTSRSPLPFAPVRVEVHPLSHLDVDGDGVVRLIAHVELVDRWGDTTKARGLLRMELYRPGVEVRPDLLTQEQFWELDLRELDLNAALFDPATRTYRLQLGGLPGWAEEMARRLASGGEGQARERLLVRAVFETQGPDGRPTVLRDEMQIEG